MEENCFHWPEKLFLLGAMKFFFKNWLPYSFNNGFHQQKALNKIILSQIDRKGSTAFVSTSGNYY